MYGRFDELVEWTMGEHLDDDLYLMLSKERERKKKRHEPRGPFVVYDELS